MNRLFVRLTLAAIITTTAVTVVLAEKPGQETIPLKFTSKLDPVDLPASMLRQPVVLKVTDGRDEQDPLVIGALTKDDDSSPIKTGDDVAKFVSDAIAKMNTKWSVQTADKADLTLKITVTRFHLDDTLKKLGSWYNGEVKLKWQLTNSHGKVIAEDTAEGSSHRYGRSGSENSDEVLSEALKDAYQNILTDDGLQTAWKGR